MCILRQGVLTVLSDAEKAVLKSQEECLQNVLEQPTFEAAKDIIRDAFESEVQFPIQDKIEEIKTALIEKLKADQETFYATGFSFICSARPDEILIFDSDKASGKSIQSRVELRKDVLALQAGPEKVTMQNNHRILMQHEEFAFFYQQLSYFISVVEDTFNDAREALLKAITVADLLAVPVPDYNAAVVDIPRTFMPIATIWERRDNYMNNTCVVQWLQKWLGDGYINESTTDVE